MFIRGAAKVAKAKEGAAGPHGSTQRERLTPKPGSLAHEDASAGKLRAV
jgi:hypothetical protein